MAQVVRFRGVTGFVHGVELRDEGRDIAGEFIGWIWCGRPCQDALSKTIRAGVKVTRRMS